MVIKMAKVCMAHASTHGARKPPGPKRKKEKRKLVITMAKLRMAHASTHGARNPPGPIVGWKKGKEKEEKRILQGLGVGPGSTTERWL